MRGRHLLGAAPPSRQWIPGPCWIGPRWCSAGPWSNHAGPQQRWSPFGRTGKTGGCWGAASELTWHCCPGTGTRGPSYENGRKGGRPGRAGCFRDLNFKEGKWQKVGCGLCFICQETRDRTSQLGEPLWAQPGAVHGASRTPEQVQNGCRMSRSRPSNPAPSNTGATGHMWAVGPLQCGE